MAAPEQVHWKQGLFLQPQHLQLMQRHLLERICELRQYTMPHPYGVVSWSLDEEGISTKGVVRFRSLHVFTKSGLELKYSEIADPSSNTELSPLDVVRPLDSSNGSLTVYLAIPQWQAQRANSLDPGTADASRADALYIVRELSLLDENEANESRNEKKVDIRRFNARLMTSPDVPGFEALPLLLIRRGTQAEQLGKPTRDRNYVPPCLFVNSSQEIRVMVQSLSEKIRAGRQELAKNLPKDGFNLAALREAQIGPLIKLQALNRAAAKIPAMIELGNTPLFHLYLELRAVLGDLVAMKPEDDDRFETPKYQHEDPHMSFSEVCSRIEPYLPTEVGDSNVVKSIPFEDKAGKLVAAMAEEYFTKPSHYYVMVQTSADPTELVKYVEEGIRFKLKALSRYGDAVRGIRLIHDVDPHKSLNRAQGQVYFRLDRTGDGPAKEWAFVTAEKELAIKTPSLAWYQNAKYTLQMIIPAKVSKV